MALTDLTSMVQSGEVSAVELTQHALNRIEALNPMVNAFVSVDGERALAEAAALDQRRRDGEEMGPLAGLPIGVKDLEDAAGFRTTFGSAIAAHDALATADSLLVDRLRDAGCVIVGKTNTPEHGYKGDTTNPTFGATRNPWNLERSAGGSSGGSAAAVASGMVPLATGSDGGGSIRIPASVCGLAGMKPSPGRVPLGGPHPPPWGRLAVKGVLARTVRDSALALDVVIGPDPSDLLSLPMPEQSWLEGVDDLHLPRRVAWSSTLGYAPVDGEVQGLCEAALRRIEDAGTEVVPVDPVFDKDPVSDFLVVSGVGTFHQLEQHRGTPQWDLIDPELRFLLEMASTVSSSDHLRSLNAGHYLNLRLVELFHQSTFLLTPTVAGQPGPAGGVGTINGTEDANWIRFTYPFNLTGSPAGTIPVGLTSDGMPVGLQIIGPRNADMAVLRAMASFEELLDLDLVAPDLTPVG